MAVGTLKYTYVLIYQPGALADVRSDRIPLSIVVEDSPDRSSHQAHEAESRLHRLFAVGQEKWLSQCEQLRSRIDLLEARISPWMTEPADRPRLAVIPRQDESA